MADYPTHEVWGGFTYNGECDEPIHLEDCFSKHEAELAAMKWAEGKDRYAFVRSKDRADDLRQSEVAMSEAEKVHELLTEVYTWMCEPDTVEEPSLAWLIHWINRRPIAAVGLAAMLNPALIPDDRKTIE